MSEKNKVNIKCPACGIPLVTMFSKSNAGGVFEHKCSKCRRYWQVDYTNENVTWVKGKEDATPITNFKLDLSTGNSSPFKNTNQALLSRKGA